MTGGTRPAYLRVGPLVAVATGGVLGTASRYLLGAALPAVSGWPVATLTANLVGSFLLGLLLESLLALGQETRRVRIVRLALGTGLLGGLTTFSSLALELERLLAGGAPATAVGYLVVTVVGGLGACLAGILLGGRLHPGGGR